MVRFLRFCKFVVFMSIAILIFNVWLPATHSPLISSNNWTDRRPPHSIDLPSDLQKSRTCDPPLSTKGRDIIDARGKRCKLISVNWYRMSINPLLYRYQISFSNAESSEQLHNADNLSQLSNNVLVDLRLGGSDELFVVGGLNLQHRSVIARTIRRLGHWHGVKLI